MSIASSTLGATADLNLQVFVVTWNTNKNSEYHDDLHQFFNESSLKDADVIAVGLQEVPLEHSELIAALQSATGQDHTLYAAESLGTILLVIFLRRYLISACSDFSPSFVHLRSCNFVRTKGSMAIYFRLFGASFLFLTSHLAAGRSWRKLFKRTTELRRTHDRVRIPYAPERCTPGTCRLDYVDYVFWGGDFNFRLSEERKSVEKIVQKVIHAQHLRKDEIRNLLAWDQLSRYKMATALRDFQEAPIDFLPTYKYDPKTHTYDTSWKQRIPSYTDRILTRCAGSESGSRIACRIYGSTANTVTSDHKPVYAVYEVVVPKVQILEEFRKTENVERMEDFYRVDREKAVRKRNAAEKLSSCGCGVF